MGKQAAVAEPETKESKQPWELAFEADHPTPEASEPEPEETQPEEESPEPEEAAKPEKVESEEPEAEDKAESEPEQEEKPAEEDAKPEEAAEKEVKSEPKPAGDDEDDKVREYAISNGLTFHDAKVEFGKIKSITEKYKNDPVEMAKALRSQQAEYDKLRTKSEAEKAEANQYQVSDNPQVDVANWVTQNKEKLVEAYRAKYPAKSEQMSDEAVAETVYEQTLANFNAWNGKQMERIKTDAGSRREQMLNSLSEKDRRFLPDIKVVLDKTPDRQILSKGFDFQHLVYWAKGQYYDKDIASAVEKAKKQAVEQPKIVGAIGNQPKGQPKSKPAASAGTLSNWEKQRARDMYPSTMSDEDCYKAYIELKTRKKK